MKKYLPFLIILVVLVGALILIMGLHSTAAIGRENALPLWLAELLQRFESHAVTNPPLFIARYNYKGQVVYYVPPRCCDIPSILYEADGTIICHPDGGVMGRATDAVVTFLLNEQTRGSYGRIRGSVRRKCSPICVSCHTHL